MLYSTVYAQVCTHLHILKTNPSYWEYSAYKGTEDITMEIKSWKYIQWRLWFINTSSFSLIKPKLSVQRINLLLLQLFYAACNSKGPAKWKISWADYALLWTTCIDVTTRKELTLCNMSLPWMTLKKNVLCRNSRFWNIYLFLKYLHNVEVSDKILREKGNSNNSPHPCLIIHFSLLYSPMPCLITLFSFVCTKLLSIN